MLDAAAVLDTAGVLDATTVLDAAGVLDAAAVLDVAGALDAPKSVLDAIVLAESCAEVKAAVVDAATAA